MYVCVGEKREPRFRIVSPDLPCKLLVQLKVRDAAEEGRREWCMREGGQRGESRIISSYLVGWGERYSGTGRPINNDVPVLISGSRTS